VQEFFVGRTFCGSKNLYTINLVGGDYPSQVPKLLSSSTLMLVIRITKSYGSFMMWLVAYNGTFVWKVPNMI